jgi:peptidyl-prolyl cis-trans isomerase C
MIMTRSGFRASLPALPAAALLIIGLQAHAMADSGVPAGSEVLAKVDGEAVTLGDLDAILPASTEAVRQLQNNPPEAILKRMIQNRLLEQEGYRLGADESFEIKNQVDELKRHQSVIALMDSIAAPVERPDRTELDSLFTQSNRMNRIAHILVDSESEGLALLDSLKAGVPFAALEERHSRDTTWAGEGGDVGWAREGLLIPEFEEVVADLEKGDFAGPVKTEKGWHLLQLSDVRIETVGQSEAMQSALYDAIMKERVMNLIKGYVDNLKERYGVTVNEDLLATLDYASADPEVQQRLRESEETLAVMPWREFTIKDLSRAIRFQYFHGTEGKADAPEIRDKMFDEELTQALLRHEAIRIGLHKRPEIVARAEALERKLLREKVLGMVADIPFDPGEEEVEAYYQEHPEAFTPAPRLRVDAAVLEDEQAAGEFRRGLEEGAGVGWLAKRTPAVIDPEPQDFSGWLEAEMLQITPAEAEKGGLVGPLAVPGGWAVAKIVAKEKVTAAPLDECRGAVLGRMKNEAMHQAISDAVARLESAAEIEIMDGAAQKIEDRIDYWIGR